MLTPKPFANVPSGKPVGKGIGVGVSVGVADGTGDAVGVDAKVAVDAFVISVGAFEGALVEHPTASNVTMISVIFVFIDV